MADPEGVGKSGGSSKFRSEWLGTMPKQMSSLSSLSSFVAVDMHQTPRRRDRRKTCKANQANRFGKEITERDSIQTKPNRTGPRKQSGNLRKPLVLEVLRDFPQIRKSRKSIWKGNSRARCKPNKTQPNGPAEAVRKPSKTAGRRGVAGFPANPQIPQIVLDGK